MKRWAWLCGVVGVVASCAGDSASPLGTAVQRQSAGGWKILQGADFNRDGMGDMLWYNPEANRISIWLMDGAKLLAAGPEIPGPSGAGWSAITAADFNADGMNDVIWHNAVTNQMTVWLMDGVHILAAGPEIPGPSGGGWSIGTAVDTNLDGMADVVWLNDTTGQMAVWLMNGTGLLAAGPEIPGPDAP